MKKLMVGFISILVLTGCSKNLETVNLDEEKEIVTTPNTEITSNMTTSTTTSVSTSLQTEATSKITAKSEIKTTTKKITTTKKSTTKKTTTTTAFKLTEADVKAAILSLKSKYPNGTSWTNENRSYKFKASNINLTGKGCAAFALEASDAAFGTLPIKKLTTFDKIRVGDIIRYMNDTHSVIVLEVKNNAIVVAEGNVDFSDGKGGVVYWGREVPLSEIKETGTYIYTRWP